jgi:hypothetical protein
MPAIPLSKGTLTNAFRANIAPGAPEAEAKKPQSQRTAIFAVHGISPIQRYAFQNQVALAFQSYLNSQEPFGTTTPWKAVVHWPKVASDNADGSTNARPSAMRLYRDGDDPDAPQSRVYDVYEGYWSPFSKGKTNIASALQWLLNGTFLATSSTANIPCKPAKLRSDVTYIAVLLALAILGCTLAIGLGVAAWIFLAHIVPSVSTISYVAFVQDPLRTALKLPPVVYLEFALDVVIGYVFAQLIVAYKLHGVRDGCTAALRPDASEDGTFEKNTISAHAFHRAMFRLLLGAFFVLIVASVLIAAAYVGWRASLLLGLVGYAAAVALSMASLQYARAKADFAVESVLGDVQIYTTHDANSAFFAIRQQIIGAVAAALRGVLSAVVNATEPKPKPYYDSIHIFGHSLGSTISMDVLILLRQMLKEGSVAKEQWNNIRSLTTFGAALEKTRFFFDVRQPTLNAAQDQWENDVYGQYFTDQMSALQEPDNSDGIYWLNCWYFRDIVANEIVSYTSDSAVGGNFKWSTSPRRICDDFMLQHDKPRFAWVHSDYLADPLFWGKAGPVLTDSG